MTVALIDNFNNDEQVLIRFWYSRIRWADDL